MGVEPFLVLNGDVWMDYPYARLRERFASGLPGKDQAHLVLVPNPPHNAARRLRAARRSHGRARAGHGRRHARSAQRIAALPRYTFSGLGVYHPSLFNGCSDGIFKLAPLLRAAAVQARVGVELFEGDWLDIGTPERLAALNARLAGVAARHGSGQCGSRHPAPGMSAGTP